MVQWSSIRKIINRCGSTSYDDNGKLVVKDASTFRGMPLDDLKKCTTLIDNGLKEEYRKLYGEVKTLDDCKTEAKLNAKKMIKDSMFNNPLNIGNNTDPYTASQARTNIWLSPFEANAIYSQKGLGELIINKKAKSILLNGVKIKNSKLTAKELDKVTENIWAKGVSQVLSGAIRDSLIYGGDLVFPMFKKETPITLAMDMKTLLSAGVLGKDCIDYIISLDRWNTMIIPPKNPTEKTFNNPDRYYIPYLGAWVDAKRCSRIVTAQQAGWYGAMYTMGWGISDLCGYMQEILNYNVTIQTIPQMIQQMSILVRSVNMDGILASEGINALQDVLDESSVKVNNVSTHNPINYDILGELQVINRDFKQVPEMIHLLRQDLAAKAGIPEPMLFSSDKGAFSSGDDTEGNLTKQWENVKYIHKTVEPQFKHLAQLLIIDALGTDKRIIEALPYTQIHFDTPIIANAQERAKIGKELSEAFFNFVGGQVPMDKAMQITSTFAGDDMSISSELLEELKTLQAKADALSIKSQEAQIDLTEAQVEKTEQDIATSVESVPKTEKKEGYDRLEQKKHEKNRLGLSKRKEKKVKAVNNALSYMRNRNKIEKSEFGGKKK